MQNPHKRHRVRRRKEVLSGWEVFEQQNCSVWIELNSHFALNFFWARSPEQSTCRSRTQFALFTALCLLLHVTIIELPRETGRDFQLVALSSYRLIPPSAQPAPAPAAPATFTSNRFSCSVLSIRYDMFVPGRELWAVGQTTSLVAPAVACPSLATPIPSEAVRRRRYEWIFPSKDDG